MRKGAATPSFDRLYDCARKLDGAELVLELRSSCRAAGDDLWLVLRTLDRERLVQEFLVETTVEAAATLMIDAVESDAADV